MIDKNLKGLMNKAGITSSQLARSLGVKLPIVHRLLSGENKNPTLLTLKLFADYFHVSVGQLLGETDIVPFMATSQSSQTHVIPFSQKINDVQKSELLVDTSISKDSFAFVAPNADMEPAIPKNAVVIVDPAVKPSNRDFIVIQKDNNFFIRFFLAKEEGDVLLSTLNCFDMISTKLMENQLVGTVVRVIYSRPYFVNDSSSEC